MKNSITIGTITIKRFNGDEIWNITDGEFSVSPRKDYFILNIWISSAGDLVSKPPEENVEDEETDYSRFTPRIELQTKIRLEDYQYLSGKRFEFLIEDACDEDDDNFSNFYYYGHQETYYNLVEILERKEEFYHLRTLSSATDVSYYDGSKPNNEIIIDCWLVRQKVKTGY